MKLGLDLVPKETVLNVLHRSGREMITYENDFPTKKREFISENQVKYVEDIIVKIDTSNRGMSRKEVIQLTSELVQENLLVQANNQLE